MNNLSDFNDSLEIIGAVGAPTGIFISLTSWRKSFLGRGYGSEKPVNERPHMLTTSVAFPSGYTHSFNELSPREVFQSLRDVFGFSIYSTKVYISENALKRMTSGEIKGYLGLNNDNEEIVRAKQRGKTSKAVVFETNELSI